MNRRGFLQGIASVVAAPAVITTPGLLMPLRGLVMPRPDAFGYSHLSLGDGGYIFPEALSEVMRLILEHQPHSFRLVRN